MVVPAWLHPPAALAAPVVGCPVCLSSCLLGLAGVACKWHTLHMKLEIIFQFTNETFRTHSCRSEETLKFATAGRNGTPPSAVVNQAKGPRDQDEKWRCAILHCTLASSVAIVICAMCRSVPALPPVDCAACCCLCISWDFSPFLVAFLWWGKLQEEITNQSKRQERRPSSSSSKEVVDAEPTPGAECQCHILCQKCTQTTYPAPYSPTSQPALLPSNVESYCTLQMNNLCARSSADGWSRSWWWLWQWRWRWRWSSSLARSTAVGGQNVALVSAKWVVAASRWCHKSQWKLLLGTNLHFVQTLACKLLGYVLALQPWIRSRARSAGPNRALSTSGSCASSGCGVWKLSAWRTAPPKIDGRKLQLKSY